MEEVSNEIIEERIQECLYRLVDGIKPNFAKLAAEKRVPYQRLLARYKGRPSLFERESATKKLDNLQEDALRNYIARNDNIGISTRVPMVVGCVNYLLQAHHEGAGPPPTASIRWAKNWQKQQPDLFLRRQQALEIDRATAHDENTIMAWHREFNRVRRVHGIQDCDTWNFDETGFRIGIGKDQWVITFQPKTRQNSKLYLATPDDRTSLTMVECVNGVGDHIDPLVILEGGKLLDKYFVDLPPNYLVGISDSGYINDSLGLEWVRHFNRFTKGFQKGKYRMLLFDGAGSHTKDQFLQHCEDNYIIPFQLPSHTSHFLQPLDVGVFQPYKHWHAQAVDNATRTGCTKFNKVEFLAAIESIRYHTFKPSIIRSGWQKAGLIPPREEIIRAAIQRECQAIRSIEETQYRHENRPATPPPCGKSSPIQIPESIRTFKRSTFKIAKKLDFDPHLTRVLQACNSMAVQGEQAVAELKTTTALAQSRRLRQKRGRNIASNSMGILYAGKAKKMNQDRLWNEIKATLEANWKLKRAPLMKQKTHQAAYKQVNRQFLDYMWAQEELKQDGLFYWRHNRANYSF